MSSICSLFGPIFSAFGSVFAAIRDAYTSLGLGYLGDFFYSIFGALVTLTNSILGCDFG